MLIDGWFKGLGDVDYQVMIEVVMLFLSFDIGALGHMVPCKAFSIIIAGRTGKLDYVFSVFPHLLFTAFLGN